MPYTGEFFVKKRNFKGIQIVLFISVTYIAWTFIYYFPNMPPLVKNIVKNRVDLIGEEQSSAEPDARFMAWFDRDPDRKISSEPNIIVAPADGFVDAITTTRGKQHVVIEMRYTDVHVQRIPISGKVTKIEGGGLKLPKDLSIGDYALEKMAPYQKVTTISSDIGEVVVHQITSFFANRILVFVKEGDFVERGNRLGRIIAGSTVVVELPMNVEILVKKEQDVFGGETIIGKY